MRLSCIRQPIMERQFHFPVTKMIDKQSPWRGTPGDNKSFGGINLQTYKNKDKQKWSDNSWNKAWNRK